MERRKLESLSRVQDSPVKKVSCKHCDDGKRFDTIEQ